MIGLLRVLLTPACWSRCFPTDRAWDDELRQRLRMFDFTNHNGRTAYLGSAEICVTDHPDWSFHPANNYRRLPSRRTALAAHRKLRKDLAKGSQPFTTQPTTTNKPNTQMKLAPKCSIKVGNAALWAAVAGLIESLFPDHRWNDGSKPSQYPGTHTTVEVNTGRSTGGMCRNSSTFGTPSFDAATEFGKLVDFFETAAKALAEPLKVTFDIEDKTVTVDKTGIQFGCTKFSPDDLEKIFGRYNDDDNTLKVAGRELNIEPGDYISDDEADICLDSEQVERLETAWKTVKGAAV